MLQHKAVKSGVHLERYELRHARALCELGYLEGVLVPSLHGIVTTGAYRITEYGGWQGSSCRSCTTGD
jgi:hypothetical protein